ncbi:MAG: hypothetical protein PHW22_04750 [Bacilli bacterium]|nr:hypothetical protein [Bacilli bacterium]
MKINTTLLLFFSVLMLNSCTNANNISSQSVADGLESSLLDGTNEFGEESVSSSGNLSSDNPNNSENYFVGMLPNSIRFDNIDFYQHGIFDIETAPLVELLGYLVHEENLDKYDNDTLIYCPVEFESVSEEKLPVYSVEGYLKNDAIAVKAFLTNILFTAVK